MKLLQTPRSISSLIVVLLLSALLALSRQQGAVNATSPSPAPEKSGTASEGSTTPNSSEEVQGAAASSSESGVPASSAVASSATQSRAVTKGDIAMLISPYCALRGSKVSVAIQTIPLADVSHAASFADGNHHNLYGLGQADLDGKYLWQFVVPMEAALGEVRVLVGSSYPGKGGGSAMGMLQVAAKDECR